MYKYSLKEHYKHGYRKYHWGNWYRISDGTIEEMLANGWPTDYTCRYFVMHKAYDTVYFSKTKLQHVPVYGYLIPVHFFNEEIV